MLEYSGPTALNQASKQDLRPTEFRNTPPAPPLRSTSLTLDEPDGSQRELLIEYHSAGPVSFHPETGGPHLVIDRITHGGLEITPSPDTQDWILRGLHELESFATDPEPEDFS